MVNETPTDWCDERACRPRSDPLKFRAQSLLAYVLEPVEPLPEWLTALDAWLARSPTFFIARPVILDMAALEITLKEYRDLLNGLARRHIRVMGAGER